MVWQVNTCQLLRHYQLWNHVTLYVAQVSVGSLEIPGFPSAHSRFPESSSPSRFPYPGFFLVRNPEKSGKIQKIGVSDSRDQNKNLKFLWFFYTAGISYINLFFRAPRPLKPLKSRPRGQNLPGDPLIAQSDHRGPVSAQFYGLCCLFLTLSQLKWPYFKLNKWSS